jgi:hypothetical protein
MISQNDTPGKAGTVARAFRGGGKTDWFLPSRDELNALCKWAFNDTVNAICNNNGSGGLSLTNGNFASGYYWTSSETSVASEARDQYFYFLSGAQNFDSKSVTSYVRPVRAF